MITRSAKKVHVEWKVDNDDPQKTLDFYAFSEPTRGEVMDEIMGENYQPIMEFRYESQDIVLGIEEDVFLENAEEVKRKVRKVGESEKKSK